MTRERAMDSVKTVGREPTLEMLAAGSDAYLAMDEDSPSEMEAVIWRAMWDKAAASPAGAEVVAEPLYKRVEAILDEYSAWITTPNEEVTKRIALSAMFAAHAVLTEEATPDIRPIAEMEVTSELDSALKVMSRSRDRQARNWVKLHFPDFVTETGGALEPTPSTDAVRRQAREEAARQVDAAREFIKRHPALTLIDLAEFEAFLKVERLLSTPPAGADEQPG